MSGPVVIDHLESVFIPVARADRYGEPTRYICQACISWPRPEGGDKYICQVRRLRPGKGRPGAWRKKPVGDEPGPAVVIRQRRPDCEQGASYELRTRRMDGGDFAYAHVDFPPAVATMPRPGQERTAAFPIARTATLILLWIRAERDFDNPEGYYAVQVAYHLTAQDPAGGVEAWAGPTLAGWDGWASALIGGLDRATEYEIDLTITTGAVVHCENSDPAARRMIDKASESLTLTAGTLAA